MERFLIRPAFCCIRRLRAKPRAHAAYAKLSAAATRSLGRPRRVWNAWLLSRLPSSTSLRCHFTCQSPSSRKTTETTSSTPIAASAIGTLCTSSSTRLTPATVTDCTAVGPIPDSTRRIALMPIAALASSPVERSAKKAVGSRSSRSQTAGCNAASIRPSRRSSVNDWSSMNAAETTPATITATHICAISPVCARGTYAPSTCPVATGTSAPSATVTRPLRTRLRRSPREPRRLKNISRRSVSGPSGSGR